MLPYRVRRKASRLGKCIAARPSYADSIAGKAKGRTHPGSLAGQALLRRLYAAANWANYRWEDCYMLKSVPKDAIGTARPEAAEFRKKVIDRLELLRKRFERQRIFLPRL